MKKFAALVLALVMCLSLCACESKEEKALREAEEALENAQQQLENALKNADDLDKLLGQFS